MTAQLVEVRTQMELDAALKREGVIPVCVGDGYFEIAGSASVSASGSASVRAYGSASVSAYGSASVSAYDSASVRAYDSASVSAYDSASVRAYGSASVRAYDSASVRASGSATVRAYGSATVSAYGSATVRASGSATVRASGSASVSAYGSASVRASPYVAVHDHNAGRTKITGGVVITPPKITSVQEWLDYYGIKAVRGVVTLYKGVNDAFKSSYGSFDYAPGTKPVAPDWDGGERECGGGLHFSPTPGHTLQFAPDAARFVACPVRVKDICWHDDPMYPTKIKAKGCCKPVFEVDIHGQPTTVLPEAASA